MKTGSILALLALVITAIIPPVTIHDVTNNDQPSIFALDVCTPLNSAAAANANMLSLHECMCSLASPASTSFYIALNPVFNPFIIVFPEDRPPRA